jgi:hypothetical protein
MSHNNHNIQQNNTTSDIDGLKMKENVQQVILQQEKTLPSTSTSPISIPSSSSSSSSTSATSTTDALKAASPPSASGIRKKKIARCGNAQCKKKIGLTGGLPCKCQITFCPACRDPIDHNCTFDFKAAGRAKIRDNNPKVVASKINKI